MKIDEIKQLAEIMKQNNLSELEIKEKDCVIKLASNVTVAVPQTAMPQIVQNTTIETSAPAVSEDMGSEINSPMVGVFYKSPEPDAKPFVSVGQNVKKGDVLCIIESMKMMNEIVSDHDGVVTKTMCQDGDLIEFGQTLFFVK